MKTILSVWGVCLISGLAGCTTGRGAGVVVAAGSPAGSEAELRRNTQELLDAIAPGEVKVWDRLLDSAFIQVDENDVVRDKQQMLAELKPLGPGLIGRLAIDEFRLVLHGDVAVVTHEDAEFLDYHGQVIRSRFRNTDTRDVFFEAGAPRTRRIFQYDAAGRVSGFVDRREARDIVWRRIGDLVP